jgi:dihydroorotase
MGLKPLETLAAVTSRAAAVLGVEGGSLAPGAPPTSASTTRRKPWVVLPSALASQGKNTPFSGFEVTGRVARTIVGGRSVHID